jgi:inhibitor of KinA sporulation pathway (predicted exonuclease)
MQSHCVLDLISCAPLQAAAAIGKHQSARATNANLATQELTVQPRGATHRALIRMLSAARSLWMTMSRVCYKCPKYLGETNDLTAGRSAGS